MRVKKYRIFDIGLVNNYFDDTSETNLNNVKILKKVTEKSYRPATELFFKLLKKYPQFRCAYSFSGIILEQLETHAPDVIKLLKKMVDTERVEILAETYHHSLSFFYSLPEFEEQVRLHARKIKKTFGVKPKVFRNTELAYNNDLATWAEKSGYKGILAEGWDHFLGWKSPNFLYRPKGTRRIKLLLKNYKLSDDIAFRFSEKTWKEYPLTADKFASWVSALNGNGQVVNLFMDYETFGEHQWAADGIFDFLERLPGELLKHPDNDFVTPSQAISRYPVMDEVDIPYIVTWADTERDLSAWVGNAIQKSAVEFIYSLEAQVKACGDKKIIEDWRRLTTSDHFYYMCTKWFSDGDVHKYFNPYESPYDAFISYMNAANDLKLRVKKALKRRKRTNIVGVRAANIYK